MSFNLLEERWIPVLYRDGRCERVGILKAFEDAGRIRQIAATNPMDRIAVLRFLLALLYWCKGNPTEDSQAEIDGAFPMKWFAKLEEHRDCFNLLGNGTRFYQDSEANRPRPASDLTHEVPTGNNFWHFLHATDKLDGICLQCCTLGLLRLPLFSVSGLPDLKSGINGTPPVYVVPWKRTLHESLLANWTCHEDLGNPSWMQPCNPSAASGKIPLLAGLTLPSRRVWLHDGNGSGTCIACGESSTPVVRTCEYQTAGKQETETWDDPHVIYVEEKTRKSLKSTDLTATGRFRMDRPWPELVARVLSMRSEVDGIQLLIVGFSTDKAKYVDVWERMLMIPSSEQGAERSAALVRQWLKQGDKLRGRLGRRKDCRAAPAVADVRPHIEGQVSARVGEVIAQGEEGWLHSAEEYGAMMKSVAGALSPGFTTESIQRRRHIARVRPDMRVKKEPTSGKKPRQEKGEQQ